MKSVTLKTMDLSGEERSFDLEAIYQKDAKWLIDNGIELVLEEIEDDGETLSGQMNVHYATVDGNAHTYSELWVSGGRPRDYFRELVKKVKKERTSKNRKIEKEKLK